MGKTLKSREHQKENIWKHISRVETVYDAKNEVQTRINDDSTQLWRCHAVYLDPLEKQTNRQWQSFRQIS